MPGKLCPLQQGIRVSQRCFVGCDLRLNILLAVLHGTDLGAHLTKLFLKGNDRVVSLCLFSADQGKLLLHLCTADILLRLQCLKTRKSGFNGRAALHFLKDARPFFLQLLPQVFHICGGSFRRFSGLGQAFLHAIKRFLCCPDLSGKRSFLCCPLFDIRAQDLLLFSLTAYALLRAPDLLFEDLDITLDPALHNAGVSDPAPDRLDPALKLPAALLQLFDLLPERFVPRLCLFQVLRGSGLLSGQFLELAGVFFILNQKSIDIQTL